MTRLTTKQRELIRNYVLELVTEYREDELDTLPEKISDLKAQTERVCFYPSNVHRFKGDVVAMVADYLRGLPLGIEFMNYRILELGTAWGLSLKLEKTQDKWLEQYWIECARALVKILKLPTYKSL